MNTCAKNVSEYIESKGITQQKIADLLGLGWNVSARSLSKRPLSSPTLSAVRSTGLLGATQTSSLQPRFPSRTRLSSSLLPYHTEPVQFLSPC